MGNIVRLTNEIERRLLQIHEKPLEAINILLGTRANVGLNDLQKKEVLLMLSDELWKVKNSY